MFLFIARTFFFSSEERPLGAQPKGNDHYLLETNESSHFCKSQPSRPKEERQSIVSVQCDIFPAVCSASSTKDHGSRISPDETQVSLGTLRGLESPFLEIDGSFVTLSISRYMWALSCTAMHAKFVSIKFQRIRVEIIPKLYIFMKPLWFWYNPLPIAAD